jgi:hypothetical protein
MKEVRNEKWEVRNKFSLLTSHSINGGFLMQMKALEKQRSEIYGKYPLKPADSEDAEPRSLDGLRVSEEEYWETYYDYVGENDFSYEWNDGVLEEKPMGDHLSYLMFDWFYLLLKQYLEANHLAKIFGTDMGFRLALQHKTTIRKPDLSLILDSNPVRFDLSDRSYKGIFDICFEFLSDSIKKYAERDTIHKRSEYAGIRVKEYFILDRLGKQTAFYRLNRKGFYSSIRPIGGIIRSAVLPGFQFRRDDLYTRPHFRDIIADPVYNAFVLKDFQAERSRAEKAEKSAEVERKKADVERKKAQKLADRLRSLGIDPDAE